MHIPQLIERKRDGDALSREEIQFLIQGFTKGEIPDFQMSAMSMAIFFSGMNEEETACLTACLRDSGFVFQWPTDSPPKIDKHSTGGVGDKVSLVLAPLLACGEVWVPMVSGRGLGITGGTLDKLESIPGFEVRLSRERATRQLESIGVFLAGQTEEFCPADKKLYALRDVSGTVPSRALIIASIMSKKLAESLDRLVLDVKYGSGAFMKTHEEAFELALGLEAAGRDNGVDTAFLLSPMDEPIGCAVGNALEVLEAMETLAGGGPPDLRKLVLDLAERVSPNSRAELEQFLDSGKAMEKFREIIEHQGGDASALDRKEQFHPAPVVLPFPAPKAGKLLRFDAGVVGATVVRMGGGRKLPSDEIDFAVGLSGIRKTGETIEQDEPLAFVHARSESSASEAIALLESAIDIQEA